MEVLGSVAHQGETMAALPTVPWPAIWGCPVPAHVEHGTSDTGRVSPFPPSRQYVVTAQPVLAMWAVSEAGQPLP